MTLNTFHLSGVGNKSVTLGIPRPRSCWTRPSRSRRPATRIRFKGALAKSADFVSFFASTLPLTRLGDVVASCEFIYDPIPT